MCEYFRPLRRKIGLVTLVLSCVLTCAWVRSEFAIDTLTFPVGSESMMSFSSQTGRFLWFSWIQKDHHPNEPIGWTSQRRNFEDHPVGDGWEFPFESRVSKGWKYGGPKKKYWIIWYWAVVIPFTLLSASLLMSKSRALKPKTDSKSES